MVLVYTSVKEVKRLELDVEVMIIISLHSLT